MSATEVIELIRKQSPEDQEKAFAFGDQVRAQGTEQVRRVDRERASAVAKSVFDPHPELFRKLAQ